jgi:hypothetical protein
VCVERITAVVDVEVVAASDISRMVVGGVSRLEVRQREGTIEV